MTLFAVRSSGCTRFGYFAVVMFVSACGIELTSPTGSGTGSNDGDDGGDGPWAPYKTYFIAQEKGYASPSVDPACASNAIFDDTSQLVQALGPSWNGPFHHDESAMKSEQTDFIEASFGGQFGQDHIYADAATLAVYSGHGLHNELCFASQYQGDCSLQIGATTPTEEPIAGSLRLGRLGGGLASVVIWDASCVGYTSSSSVDPDALDFWKTIGLSDSLQHFAFRDSPIVNEDMLAIWFEELSFGVAYNTTEWFEQLSIPSATDVNQPVAFSIENEFEAIGYAYDRAELANLATGAYIEGIQLGLPTYGVWSSSLDDEDPFNNDPIPSTCSSYYF